jgi:hypothetical protein
MAILPAKYFCSSCLLFPKYERISLSTWPDRVRGESPPGPDAPALFETAVSECKESTPRRCIAPIRVSVQSISELVILNLWFGRTCSPAKPKPRTKNNRATLQIRYSFICILEQLRCPTRYRWRQRTFPVLSLQRLRRKLEISDCKSRLELCFPPCRGRSCGESPRKRIESRICYASI